MNAYALDEEAEHTDARESARIQRGQTIHDECEALDARDAQDDSEVSHVG